MKIFILSFTLLLTACIPSSKDMTVKNAYMYATPQTFPAVAVFMDVENNSGANDRLIDFKMDNVGRTEIHTMEMVNDIMKMRRVDGFDVLHGDSLVLKPMGKHLMGFDMTSDFNEGDVVNGIAVFEKYGEVPVTITVKNRSQMKGHSH